MTTEPSAPPPAATAGTPAGADARTAAAAPVPADVDPERERAATYALLARLWWAAPDEALLDALRGTPDDGDASHLGAPWRALVAEARATDAETARRAFGALFDSPGRAAVLPYASMFLAGVLNDQPLADLRADLALLGLEGAVDGTVPEDHIALVLDAMRLLIESPADAVDVLDAQRRFFRRHLQPWVGALADQVQAHGRNAPFHAAVAAFTRAFVEVESQAFDLLEAEADEAATFRPVTLVRRG